MHRFLLAVLRRDLTLAARRRGDWLIAQFFFVMVASLFPLGIGPEPEMLARIGPGVLWVAATLASLLSLSRLFADDHHDGSLEHMVLSPEPTVELSLLLGTPILSLLGSVGAALTLGLRGGGVLLTLLILPLYVPALIFGAGAVDGVMMGTGAEAHLSLLGAFMVLSLMISPWIAAAALRVSLE
jgi:heme exporter protein B